MIYYINDIIIKYPPISKTQNMSHNFIYLTFQKVFVQQLYVYYRKKNPKLSLNKIKNKILNLWNSFDVIQLKQIFLAFRYYGNFNLLLDFLQKRYRRHFSLMATSFGEQRQISGISFVEMQQQTFNQEQIPTTLNFQFYRDNDDERNNKAQIKKLNKQKIMFQRQSQKKQKSSSNQTSMRWKQKIQLDLERFEKQYEQLLTNSSRQNRQSNNILKNKTKLIKKPMKNIK